MKIAAMLWVLMATGLPDPKLTPGATVTITVEKLCTTKWGKEERNVTAAMKRQVFASYGLSGNLDKSCRSPFHFEVDHLISRELGGADEIANLWPQCYSGRWNARQKDRLENRLHKEVCAGRLTLEEAQTMIKTDWRQAFRKYYTVN